MSYLTPALNPSPSLLYSKPILWSKSDCLKLNSGTLILPYLISSTNLIFSVIGIFNLATALIRSTSSPLEAEASTLIKSFIDEP